MISSYKKKNKKRMPAAVCSADVIQLYLMLVQEMPAQHACIVTLPVGKLPLVDSYEKAQTTTCSGGRAKSGRGGRGLYKKIDTRRLTLKLGTNLWRPEVNLVAVLHFHAVSRQVELACVCV